MTDNILHKNNPSIEVRQFIWQQGLALGTIQSEKIISDFIQQMNKKTVDVKSSLAMLPSFLHMPDTLETDRSFIAIDAGGSNLRCAVIRFSILNDHYEYKIEQESHHAMPGTLPGTVGKLSKTEFFNQLFMCLEPFLEFSETIGFCFSYPCEISNNLDGKLIRWTKEVNAPEVENLWIAQELNAVIQKSGHTPKKIILLNDTVATLLSSKLNSAEKKPDAHDAYSAHKADKAHSAHIALILGTGTNCAFTEVAQQEIINIESGAYNGIINTTIDANLDKKSLNPNEYSFEKKISGRYLGNLCLELLKLAATQHLFSQACCDSIDTFSKSKNLDSEQLNQLLNSNTLLKGDTTDQITIRFLIDALIERAALFTAIQLFAVSKKIKNDLSASSQSKLHINITIEGSTYYQLADYQEKITHKFQYFMEREGISYQLFRTEHASLLGAAIAAAGKNIFAEL